jgi:hypothetical protein
MSGIIYRISQLLHVSVETMHFSLYETIPMAGYESMNRRREAMEGRETYRLPAPKRGLQRSFFNAWKTNGHA